jgi:hypothetical protein
MQLNKLVYFAPHCRYGDVNARTDGERIIASFCMLLGAFMYAYVVGSVCSIATSFGAEANECVPRQRAPISPLCSPGTALWIADKPCAMTLHPFRRFRNTMDKVNAYMKTYRAPGELRDRVRAYVVHCRGLKREQGFRKVGPALHSWGPGCACAESPHSQPAQFECHPVLQLPSEPYPVCCL